MYCGLSRASSVTKRVCFFCNIKRLIFSLEKNNPNTTTAVYICMGKLAKKDVHFDVINGFQCQYRICCSYLVVVVQSCLDIYCSCSDINSMCGSHLRPDMVAVVDIYSLCGSLRRRWWLQWIFTLCGSHLRQEMVAAVDIYSLCGSHLRQEMEL